MYTDINGCILNNGWVPAPFMVFRGIRQGLLYPKYTAKFLTGSFVQEMFSYLSLVCFNLPSQIPSVLFLFPAKRSVLSYDYLEGGLKMTNIDTYIKALQITWILRLLENSNE
jgi:hypothetical protein